MNQLVDKESSVCTLFFWIGICSQKQLELDFTASIEPAGLSAGKILS